MFEIITRIILWVLLGYVIWYVIKQLIPQIDVKWLLPLLMSGIILLAFFFPTDPSIATAWTIISFPLKPVGLCIILLWGIVIPGSKGKKLPDLAKNPLVWVLLILLLSSIPWVSRQLEYMIIRSNVPAQQICNQTTGVAANQTANAIVLLAESITQPGQPYRPQKQIEDVSDRILKSVVEYNRQRALGSNAPILVSARPTPSWANQPSEFQLIRTQLINLGVPETSIRLISNNVNIKQTTEAVKQYFNEQAITNPRIILVSSAVYIPRAKLTFEKTFTPQNLTVIPGTVDLYNQLCTRNDYYYYVDLTDVIPNAESLLRTTHVSNEFFSLIYYFLRNWLNPCWNCWEAGIN